MESVQEYLGILVDYKRDRDIPKKGLSMLTRRGFYKKEWEDSPQQGFARAATCFCFGDYDFAQRIYDYASKGWYTNASPVLSNAEEIGWPTFTAEQFEEAGDWLEENISPDGMPISCFLPLIPDTKEGLVDTASEARWLSMMGGGIGIYPSNRAPDEKSTGVMAHLKGYDADALSFKQTESRRGSIGVYMDITHPEILSFIEMRSPVGGDSNKKCFNLNNAVNITDDFMIKVIKGEKYELVDLKHGPTDRWLDAREVWEKIMQMRYETGEPYLHFIDTTNKNIPSWVTKPTYQVRQSNLCSEIVLMTSTKRTAVCCLSSLNLDKYDEWKDTTIVEDLIRYLDNVLEYFIRLAPPELKRAVYSAQKERAVGLGTLGYHSYLQRHKIPFESGGFNSAASKTHEIYSLIKSRAVESSKQLAKERGEPDDCYGSGMRNSHLCVDKDTKIATKKGLLPISKVVGEEVEIWNGYEWSKVTPFKTGENRKLLKVSLSDGRSVVCTEDHRWKVASPERTNIGLGGNKQVDVETQHLRIGDCIPKTLGCVIDDENLPELPHAYTSGAFCGDGSINNAMGGKYPRNEIRLYGNKLSLVDRLDWKSESLWDTTELKSGIKGKRGYLVDRLLPKYEVPVNYSLRSRLEWLAGLIDTDGSSNSSGISISTNNKEMAEGLLDVLQTLGCFGNITESVKEAGRLLYSVQISLMECSTLGYLGLNLSRVKLPTSVKNTLTKLPSKQFVKVVSVEDFGKGDTYCLTDPKNGTCVFNGVYTAQCAIAPNASSSDMVGVSPSIEPWAANAFLSEGRAGSFLIKNPHLERHLEEVGLNTDDMWDRIRANSGSLQGISGLPEWMYDVYKTFSEIDPRWIIELAAIRQPEICQSQSLNIKVKKDITLPEMSDIHVLAWAKKLKTMYYCRAEKPTKIVTRVSDNAQPLNSVQVNVNFEECLSCQG